MEQAGWEWQHELEKERIAEAVAALDRCLEAGAKPEDIKTLARECGLTTYDPFARTARVGH